MTETIVSYAGGYMQAKVTRIQGGNYTFTIQSLNMDTNEYVDYDNSGNFDTYGDLPSVLQAIGEYIQGETPKQGEPLYLVQYEDGDGYVYSSLHLAIEAVSRKMGQKVKVKKISGGTYAKVVVGDLWKVYNGRLMISTDSLLATIKAVANFTS